MGGLLHQWLLLNSMLRQLNSPNCCSPVNTQSEWRENAICCRNFSGVDYCPPDGHVPGRGATLTAAVPVRHRSAEKQERKYEDITSRPPAVAVSAGLSTFVCGEARAEIEGKRALIEQWVTAEMAKEAIPGVAIAVAKDGKTVFAKGFGYADLENK